MVCITPISNRRNKRLLLVLLHSKQLPLPCALPDVPLAVLKQTRLHGFVGFADSQGGAFGQSPAKLFIARLGTLGSPPLHGPDRKSTATPRSSQGLRSSPFCTLRSLFGGFAVAAICFCVRVPFWFFWRTAGGSFGLEQVCIANFVGSHGA